MRRSIVVGAAGLALLVTGGSAYVAVAGTPAVFRQSNGIVAVDAGALHKYAYHGKEIDQAQLRRLNADGKATISLITREGACHGDILVFDTQDQATAFQNASRARRDAATRAGAQDPCAFALAGAAAAR